jgi:CheY-like chemotaxis protein
VRNGWRAFENSARDKESERDKIMADPSDKTVLVVDDEPDVVFFLQTALEDAGFNVVTATNGEEALERVKEQPPDFISCDLVMPKKSGIKFLHELRRNKKWSRIPVVIVTAHARDELGSGDLREILEGKTISGPHAYLEKPVRAEGFVDIVRKELGMEERPDEEPAEPASDKVRRELREQIKNMLDSAGADSLNRIVDILRSRKG